VEGWRAAWIIAGLAWRVSLLLPARDDLDRHEGLRIEPIEPIDPAARKGMEWNAKGSQSVNQSSNPITYSVNPRTIR
jgi:hypothetical protein